MTVWDVPDGFERALKDRFGPRARVIPGASGARTGLHLWSLTRNPDDYPPMDSGAQDMIRSRGQGRIELQPPAAQTIPGFFVYDARWMYVACLTKLPCGTYRYYDPFPAELYTPYLRGRFYVRYTAPLNWGHLGLFMQARENVHEGWWYPRHGTHETWAGWTEVLLAKERGWEVEILRGFVWENDVTSPLEPWRDRLLRIAEDHPEMARTVRDCIIHTIGAFYSAGRDETVYISREELHTVPVGTLTLRPLPDGRYQYTRRVPLPEHLRKYQHPEWSADVWARCRTRIMHYAKKERGRTVAAWGALTVPPEWIIGIRTDAIYLTDDPGWPDDGAVGSMRRQQHIAHPCDAPRSWDAVITLRKRAEAG